MRASQIIQQLSRFIEETGEDIEIQFALDIEEWHPPLKLHLFEIDGYMPKKYGVMFRFTSSGQHAPQTNEGYQFQKIAARAWVAKESAVGYGEEPTTEKPGAED